MTVGTLVWPVNSGGVLARRGRPAGRDGLTYGQYIPEGPAAYGASGVSVGLRDASLLTALNAPSATQFVLTDGTTYTNKIIYGDVQPPASQMSDITLDNCLLRGGSHNPSSNVAVVDADGNRSGSGKLIIRDCEIWPQVPAINRDGIRGYFLRAYRNYIHDVTDGILAIATSTQNLGNADCDIYGNMVERMRYSNPDYINGVSGAAAHSDGSHNDCLVVAAKGIRAKGNNLRCTTTDLAAGQLENPSHPNIHSVVLADGTNHGNGQCILITHTGVEPDATTIIEENWLLGGLTHINILANKTATVRNNRHFRSVYIDPNTADGNSSSGYWVRFTQRTNNNVQIATDRWVDGPYIGQLLTEPRDKGIHFNA